MSGECRWLHTHKQLSNQLLKYIHYLHIFVCRDKACKLGLNLEWMFTLELIKKAFRVISCFFFLYYWLWFKDLTLLCVCVFHIAYSIQGQSVQIISPSSESHQQVVAVGQPLSAQPQGTVVVRTHFTFTIMKRPHLTFNNVFISQFLKPKHNLQWRQV